MRKVSCQKYNFLKENGCSSLNSMLWADFRSHWLNQFLFSGNEFIWHWFVRVTSEKCLWSVARLGLKPCCFGIIIFNYQRAERIHRKEHSSFLCCWWQTGQTAGNLGSAASLRWDGIIYSAFLLLGYRSFPQCWNFGLLKCERAEFPGTACSAILSGSQEEQWLAGGQEWSLGWPCRSHTS